VGPLFFYDPRDLDVGFTPMEEFEAGLSVSFPYAVFCVGTASGRIPSAARRYTIAHVVSTGQATPISASAGATTDCPNTAWGRGIAKTGGVQWRTARFGNACSPVYLSGLIVISTVGSHASSKLPGRRLGR